MWAAPGVYGATATTITLRSSASASILGQAVTLTASVSPASANGAVTFYDGVNILGSVPLAGGLASLTTNLLSAGQRSLDAGYAGNGSYAPSLSGTVPLSVTAMRQDGFQPRMQYAGVNDPDGITVGDFNGDGKADFAVASYMDSGGAVVIYLGNGDGTFSRTFSQAAGNGPVAIAAADLNGDGRTDLAVANFNKGAAGNISVLLGNGDGTFQPAVNYAAGDGPASIVLADFNGDGIADIAAANEVGTISVLPGNGDGTFQPAVPYNTGGLPRSLVAGDFNGDGIADLAIGNYGGNNISLLIGRGDGTFRPATNVASAALPLSLAIGDFDDDGKPDLAFVDFSNSGQGLISVLIGAGNGTFKKPVQYIVGNAPIGLAIGDLNGDGRIDIAVLNSGSGTLSVLFGNGDGTFQTQVDYGVGVTPVALAIGEFNGDGVSDLLVGDASSNAVNVLLGKGIAAETVTTSLTSSKNPSIYGAAITLTADVSPSTATGHVIFRDAANLLGIEPLANGEATLSAALVPAGIHSLQAFYPGNESYIASLSPALTQTVTALPGNGFANPVGYGAGTNPGAAVVDDFNSDGKSDLAILNVTGYSSSVLILSGNGDGTFQPPAAYPAGQNPGVIVAGDFNGDGKPDLAVGNFNGLGVLLGNGDGTFQPFNEQSIPTDSGPTAVADFNGDGIADLVLVSAAPFVSLGNGDGTFQNAVRLNTGNNQETAIATGDFNGDGKADLVAVSDLGNSLIAVLLGNGDGTFQPPSNYGTSAPGPRAISVGDFNNDGKADVAVLTASGISIVLGNGDGTFSAAGNFAISQPGLYSVGNFVSGDFNGDGKTDLALSDLDGAGAHVRFFFGNGDGTFRFSPNDVLVDAGSLPVPGFLLTGEFNGDGRQDLALVNTALDISNTGTVNVLLAKAPPGTAPTTVTLTSSANPATLGERVTLTGAVSPATATGVVTFYDGTTVLGESPLTGGTAVFSTALLAAGSRSLSAFYDGDNTNAPGSSSTLPFTVHALPGVGFSTTAANYQTGLRFPSWVVVGDFNGDGYIDIAAASIQDVSVFPGTGNGGFGPPVNSPAESAQAGIVAGNFNGDGYTDLAVCEPSGVGILLGSAGGAFGPETIYGSLECTGTIAAGDFNGDGKADIATTSVVLLGNGDGTFQQPVKYSGGTSPVSVSVADFDGDGKADLAVSNSDGSLDILLGNGDGSFQTPLTSTAGTSPVFVISADFNGDGKPDLAVANQAANNVSVLLGNGDGTFQPAVNQDAGARPSSLGVSDFNGDGKIDLVVTNYNGGNVSVLLGNGDGTFQAPANYAAGPGANSVVVADLNGDGIADLVIGANNGVNVQLGLATNRVSNLTPTTLSLTTGLNPSNLGQSLTITAAISPAAAGGAISFFDGATPLGTSSLTNGQAGLTAGLLAPGLHQLSASYAGYITYAPSVSGAVQQLVSTAPESQLQSPTIYPTNGIAYFVVSADFNKDGTADLAVANYALGTVSIFLGNGDGNFRSAVSFNVPGAGPLSLAVADFNNDGNADIAVGGFGLLLGNGDGTFQGEANALSGYTDSFVVTADFNGDGNADLALTSDLANEVSILLGRGNGTFQPAVSYTTGGGSVALTAGDFNGDGHADLAVANYTSGNISILLGNGDGSFQLPVNYAAGMQPRSIAVADFNGDGINDLAVANENVSSTGVSDGNGTVTVLPGKGDGSFGPPISSTAGADTDAVSAADFNGDGRMDVVVTNFNDNTARVMLGAGDGTLQTATNYSVPSPRWVITGDFNGDGAVDVAAAGANGANVLLGKPSGALPFISPGGVVSAADFLGDTASGTWLAVFGSNLSSTTRTWASADFEGNNLPTSLDGVRVTINGKAAYVYYVSPTQVSVLAPLDPATGPVPVQLVNHAGNSNVPAVTKKALAPEFFSYSQQGGKYVIAQDGVSYALLAPAGLLGSTTPTHPATPGEVILLYATGLGATNPSSPDGQIVQTPAALPAFPEVQIGGIAAAVQYAGLVEAGVYQLNVVVPALPAGDASIALSLNGIQSLGQDFLSIQ